MTDVQSEDQLLIPPLVWNKEEERRIVSTRRATDSESEKAGKEKPGTVKTAKKTTDKSLNVLACGHSFYRVLLYPTFQWGTDPPHLFSDQDSACHMDPRPMREG